MSDANGMILEASGLRKTFSGFVAVGGVDLAVREGSVHALIGPNGAGKSTLFNLITGLLPADSGTVVFAGQDVTRLSPHARCKIGMGRSFQRTHIFPKLTVFGNIQAAVVSRQGRWLQLYRLLGRMGADEVDAIVEEIGLTEKARALAGELSHGDQKRLELGIVLALNPRMMFLDEPTAGMATHEKKGAMELIERIAKDRGLTLLLTEHDMDVVFAVADVITVLHRGNVLAEGAPVDIRNNEEVRDVYFGGSLWDSKSEESTASTG
jgi:branched-chain amino acid transport system ATP-binding protein